MVEVVMLNPRNIKSAEPVTRNNRGEIIPISQRFENGPDIRYMPSDHPEAIDQSAIKDEETGKIFKGAYHADADAALRNHFNLPEDGYMPRKVVHGFVDRKGKFYNRLDAYEHAKSIKQLSKPFQDMMEWGGDHSSGLEAVDFDNNRRFMPGDDQDIRDRMKGLNQSSKIGPELINQAGKFVAQPNVYKLLTTDPYEQAFALRQYLHEQALKTLGLPSTYTGKLHPEATGLDQSMLDVLSEAFQKQVNPHEVLQRFGEQPKIREPDNGFGPMGNFMPSEDQWGELHNSLTPEERDAVNARYISRIMDQFNKLDPAKGIDYALKGAARKRWYQDSAQALSNVFGPDADRFAALLSALSPQISVEGNLKNALHMWANWLDADRPTGEKAIEQLLERSVMGGDGKKSTMDAWLYNVKRALTADDPSPSKLTISGAKVNSFFNNLRNVLSEVTNDRWMQYYAHGDRVPFGSRQVSVGDPFSKGGKISIKGFDYLAFNAHIRQLAEYLTGATGEKWEPAEVQAAIWSYTKTLRESADDLGLTDEQYLAQGHEVDVSKVPDFSQFFNSKKPMTTGALRDIATNIEIPKVQSKTSKVIKQNENPF